MSAVIKRLIGVVDGSNTSFSTPTPFILGSFRPIWGGVTYEKDHPRFGCVENSSTSISLNTPPETGEEMQGFYIEEDSVGSPFHPTGLYT